MKIVKRQNRWLVVKSACTPSSTCKGRYARVGLLWLTDAGVERLDRDSKWVPAIRLSRFVTVVRVWNNLNVGTTERCAYRRALDEAIDLADLRDRIERRVVPKC